MAARALSRLDWHLRIGTAAPSLAGGGVRSGLTLAVMLGMAYGATMGSFGGISLERLRQIAYSAVKVPLLFLLTLAICLPSFFVLNTIAGVRGDFREVLRALLLSQAALAIVLAALAPYTALWYVSSENYAAAVLFNGAMFAAASAAAQMLLLRLYRPLMERNRRHRLLWAIWLVLYIFVGIQLAWVLRPYVGALGLPTRFFREESWSNAYLAIARIVARALAG